jgi:PTS system cellobiose-specific IIC component
LSTYFNQAFGATFAVMAFFATIGITMSYVKEQGIEDTLPAGMISFASFLLLMSSEVVETKSGHFVGNVINKDWTGGKGMIVAIIVGLFCRDCLLGLSNMIFELSCLMVCHQMLPALLQP